MRRLLTILAGALTASALLLLGQMSEATSLIGLKYNDSGIRVLIITGDDVDVHHWKETTAALRKILEDRAFQVTVSEDLAPLESADKLKSYDVVVLNRYNRKAPLSDAGKKNLLDFVRGGKGFYVEHLASASFADWPEFGKLCGRHWVMRKSGHGPRGPFDVKIADDKHPITEGVKDFRADDELYAKLEGTEKIHVLVEAHSDWSKKTEPLVFWLPFGEGRVVHCTLGHDAKAIETPEVTALIVNGIRWAAKGKVAK